MNKKPIVLVIHNTGALEVQENPGGHDIEVRNYCRRDFRWRKTDTKIFKDKDGNEFFLEDCSTVTESVATVPKRGHSFSVEPEDHVLLDNFTFAFWYEHDDDARTTYQQALEVVADCEALSEDTKAWFQSIVLTTVASSGNWTEIVDNFVNHLLAKGWTIYNSDTRALFWKPGLVTEEDIRNCYREEWKYEVQAGDTILGLDEWIEHNAGNKE